MSRKKYLVICITAQFHYQEYLNSMKTETEEKNNVLNRKSHGTPVFGIILIVIGAIFLLNNYGYTYIDIGKLWPLFLIIPGIGILYNYYKYKTS